MFGKLKNSAYTALLATTPFLLSACNSPKDTTTQKMEIVLIPLLFMTVSLIHDWHNKQRNRR